MRMIFGPMFGLAGRLGLHASFLLAGLLFALPVACALAIAGATEAGASGVLSAGFAKAIAKHPALALVTFAPFAAAFYFLGAIYCWTSESLARLRDNVERVAAGELTTSAVEEGRELGLPKWDGSGRRWAR